MQHWFAGCSSAYLLGRSDERQAHEAETAHVVDDLIKLKNQLAARELDIFSLLSELKVTRDKLSRLEKWLNSYRGTVDEIRNWLLRGATISKRTDPEFNGRLLEVREDNTCDGGLHIVLPDATARDREQQTVNLRLEAQIREIESLRTQLQEAQEKNTRLESEYVRKQGAAVACASEAIKNRIEVLDLRETVNLLTSKNDALSNAIRDRREELAAQWRWADKARKELEQRWAWLPW